MIPLLAIIKLLQGWELNYYINRIRPHLHYTSFIQGDYSTCSQMSERKHWSTILIVTIEWGWVLTIRIMEYISSTDPPLYTNNLAQGWKVVYYGPTNCESWAAKLTHQCRAFLFKYFVQSCATNFFMHFQIYSYDNNQALIFTATTTGYMGCH